MRFSTWFFALLLLAVGCAKDYVTGKNTLNYYSLSTDIQLGQQVIGQQLSALKKKKKKLDTEADLEEFLRIRRIVNRIVPHTHIPNFPYEVHLADLEVVNAWCAPGGKIMVYNGLWDKKKGLVEEKNEAELAAVLGHEIAHAAARHVTERISRISTIQIAGAAAASAIAVGMPQGSDLFGEVFSHGMNVYVPSYSRESESEADVLGLIYMAKAGYNPQAAVDLWERAAKKRGDETSIFASHPASGERAKALKAKLPEAIRIYEAAKIRLPK